MKKYIFITVTSVLAAYFLFGIILLAFNKFDITRGVERHNRVEQCNDRRALSDVTFDCMSTADLRWGFSFTWVQWQFLSNARGYDIAKYIPIDLVSLIITGGVVIIVKRAKTHKI